MSLGARIKEAREASGWKNQSSLADAMGVSTQMVSQWETGQSSPSIDKLPRLAEHIKTSVDWLLTGRGDPRVNAIDDERLLTHLMDLYDLLKVRDPEAEAQTTIVQLKGPPLSEDKETDSALIHWRIRRASLPTGKERRDK